MSDRLFSFLQKESTPPGGVVFPADREAWARDCLARADRAVNFDAVHAYLPWLSEAEYRKVADSDDTYAQPVSALRRMLIEAAVYGDLSLHNEGVIFKERGKLPQAIEAFEKALAVNLKKASARR